MIAELDELIAEARGLACDHPCVRGHVYESEGDRACPKGGSHCSQTAYRCARCGQWDYGEPGGPAHAECFQSCQWTPEGDGAVEYSDIPYPTG